MFCSKCGKEISDTAAFCDKCGAKTGGNSENYSHSASSYNVLEEMSQDEKVAKTRVISNYFVYAVLVLAALLMMFMGDMGLFISSIDSRNTSGYTMYELSDNDVLVVLVILGVIIAFASSIIVECILPLKKRAFDAFKGKFKRAAISRSVTPILIVMLFVFFGEFDIELAAGMYIVLVLNIGFNILLTILFNKAAEEESGAKYKENHSTSALLKKLGVEDKPEKPDASVDWVCKDCGRVNKAIDSYCKDCGKYR